MDTDMDGQVNIELSGDEMSAVAFILPPRGFGKPVDVAAVKRSLSEAGVVFGIVNNERIQTFVDEARLMPVDFLAASGTLPGHGTDATLTFLWDRSQGGLPKESDESVDLRELNIVKSVSKCEVIARKTPTARGAEGETVTGRKVAGEWGAGVAIKAGPNVSVSEDGNEFIAEIDGSPKFTGGVLSVDPAYTVNGDVDYSIGNINFAGAIEIKGNVQDGFIVTANGNITVWGNIQACEVASGGDVIVRNGIITRREGTVSAKGSVYAKFIENSIVEADNDVIVERAIISSSIRSNGAVMCSSKEGRITGGDIMAFQEIRAKRLGAENETATILRSGYKHGDYIKMSEAEQKLEKVMLEMNGAQKSLASAKAGQAEAAAELKKKLAQLDAARIALQQLIAGLRVRTQVNPFATVKGEESIYPGCLIYIGGAKERIAKELKYATLSSDREGGIALSAYDEMSRSIKTVSVGAKEKKVSVLIVDDAKFMRAKLRNILENGNFKVIGEAEDGSQAIQLHAKLNPDIVTMDITMANMDGLSALKALKKISPEAKVIMISALAQKDKVKECIVAGASDFVVKPFVPERVVEVVSRVASR
ncbi:MAG: FapA family protein [bacterium]